MPVSARRLLLSSDYTLLLFFSKASGVCCQNRAAISCFALAVFRSLEQLYPDKTTCLSSIFSFWGQYLRCSYTSKASFARYNMTFALVCSCFFLFHVWKRMLVMLVELLRIRMDSAVIFLSDVRKTQSSFMFGICYNRAWYIFDFYSLGPAPSYQTIRRRKLYSPRTLWLPELPNTPLGIYATKDFGNQFFEVAET